MMKYFNDLKKHVFLTLTCLTVYQTVNSEIIIVIITIIITVVLHIVHVIVTSL